MNKTVKSLLKAGGALVAVVAAAAGGKIGEMSFNRFVDKAVDGEPEPEAATTTTPEAEPVEVTVIDVQE